MVWNWFVLLETLTQDKTHSLVPQYGIKLQRFSKNRAALIVPQYGIKLQRFSKNRTGLILSNLTSKVITQYNWNKQKLNHNAITKTIVTISSLIVCCCYYNFQLSSVLLYLLVYTALV